MSSESTCPLVLLEPGFPTDRAGGLLRAGIAPLTQSAGSFARQEERDDGTMDPPLLEPDSPEGETNGPPISGRRPDGPACTILVHLKGSVSSGVLMGF